MDHNLLLMSVMKVVAERHGFEVLLHEKPYKGVNGSGKHCNWSLGTVSGVGLFSPGKTSQENLRFLTFMANVLKAVYDNNGLLKASIMTATNAHRLGANEAPPAIISAFLGKTVSDAFQELLGSKEMVNIKGKKVYSLGIPQIPELLVDNTDRNRTSPFAFTGNRFEFRAVGSSANCAESMATLNTIVAHQLNEFKKAVDKRVASGTAVMQAILDEVKVTYKACRSVCFDGNGYSDEWKKEAAKRGLDCESSAPKTFDQFTTDASVKIFAEANVFTKVELEARNDVRWEMYGKKVEIEARTLCDMAINHLLPVATEYKSHLLSNACKAKEIFGQDYKKTVTYELCQIEDISKHVSEAMELCKSVEKECDKLAGMTDMRKQAIGYHDKVVPGMEEIRTHLDALEMIVDDQMWPMPKYRELLFIS